MSNSLYSYQLNKLLVIVGPSGVGKGTLINKLLVEFPNYFILSRINYKCLCQELRYQISHTTRLMRNGEIDGKNYHFRNKQEFERLIEKDEFIEYGLYNGEYYGTSKSELERIFNLEVDSIGARKIYEKKIPANFVGIIPSNIETLKERLINRNTDSLEVIEKRIEIGKREYKEIQSSDMYNFIVSNRKLESSYQNFRQGIIKLYTEVIKI